MKFINSFLLLFKFSLLFGYFAFLLLAIKSLSVKLIDVEFVFLSEKAIGYHFEQMSGFLLVFLNVFAEKAEQIGAIMDKSSHFSAYLLDDGKAIFF